MKLSIVYFSPCGSTARLTDAFAAGAGVESAHGIDLCVPANRMLRYSGAPDELTLFALPVMYGRVPDICREYFARVSGEGCRAALLLNCGGEARSEALSELYTLVCGCGYEVLPAAEFVSRHTLSPELNAERPNASDLAAARRFGESTAKKFAENGDSVRLTAFGGGIPRFRASLAIEVSKNCEKCGTCAKSCPVGAINPLDPCETDPVRCVSCARCIALCPQNARRFSGDAFAKHSRLIALANPVPRDILIYI